MGDPKAFLTIHRKEAGYRPIHERIHDFSQVEQTLNTHAVYKHHVAWLAEFLFAIGLAHLVTVSRNGKMHYIKVNGETHMKFCQRHATFLNLPGESVRHFVRKVAC